MKKYITLFALLILTSLYLNAQILLRYNLEEGKNYPTVLEVVQSIDQTVMGSKQNVGSKQMMEMDMKVEAVTGGITDVHISYTRIAISQNTPMGEMIYDSDSADAEVFDAAIGYAALVDNGFNIAFNDKGKIQKVSGLDAMIERMVDRMDIVDQVQKTEMLKMMKEQFNEEILAAQIQNGLAIFPEQKIKIGDTWTVDQSVVIPFPMEVISTYTLMDYDDNNAFLVVASKIKTSEDSSMENAGMNMTVQLSGDQSGTIKINRNSGMILESSIVQKVIGTIEMSVPQEMSWPIELQAKVTVTGKF